MGRIFSWFKVFILLLRLPSRGRFGAVHPAVIFSPYGVFAQNHLIIGANVTNLPEWEKEAASAAEALCASLSAMEFGDDLQIGLIPPEEANGHNELDEDFLRKLEASEHLNDSFLSGV